MVKLISITCSGANEHIDPEDILRLARKYPILEFGIQVTAKKCSKDSPRYLWIQELHRRIGLQDHLPHLALHINTDWVDGFIAGNIAPELDELLRLETFYRTPLFERVQLNFKIGRNIDPVTGVLMEHLREYGQGRRFIFSCNASNIAYLHYLYKSGLRDFDVLYDSSFGEGIKAEKYIEPAFCDDDIRQGYAGGLSPDNITEELGKINQVVPDERSFFIDAEGQLKGSEGFLSIEKCKTYIQNALAWQSSLT